MGYQINFGSLSVASSKAAGKPKDKLRIAVLGDFSGRANSGELETGDDLAGRKAHLVDIDNLDEVVGRMGIELQLPIGADGSAVEIEIGSMDDFHPDELYENIELFEELASLRQQLASDKTFSRAAETIADWLDDDTITKHRKRKTTSRSTSIPVNGKLSDFAKLVGRSTAREDASTDVDDLIKAVVAPHVVAAVDREDQGALVAAVDEALSSAMRKILHHPDFQTMEAAWRGVEMLVRRLETSTALQIVLYDVTAEEVAADLASEDALEDTGLYKLLIEQPASDAKAGPLGVIVGNYVFEQTPPHAELLGRIAKIAAAGNAAFVASVNKECLNRPKLDEIHPLVEEAFTALKEMPEAKHLALTVPNFMLRMPYGKKSDPIEPFAFEEFTNQEGVRGMLWGNSAFLVGLLLGQTFMRGGGLKKMKLGAVLTVDDIPFQYYVDQYGDQMALPCTDRLLSERLAHFVASLGLMPILSIKGQPVVRLAGFISMAGAELAGPWLPSKDVPSEKPAAAPKGKKESGKGVGDASWEDNKAWSFEVEEDDDDDDDDSDSDSFGMDDDDSDSDSDSFGMGDDDDDMNSSLDDDDDDSSSSMDDDDSDSSSDDDDDLDALLAGMGGDDDDDDADASSDSDDSGDDDEMDPDLAALLADL